MGKNRPKNKKSRPKYGRHNEGSNCMDDFIMKPKIDFAFKELMTDEMVRKGFLAAFLKLNPNDIKSTRILNTDLRREHEDDKQGILDVRVSLNNDTEIDTEIQLTKVDIWTNRTLFYLSNYK